MQFKTLTGSYATIKTTDLTEHRMDQDHRQGKQDGRGVVYWGNDHAAVATSVGDTVKVS